MKAKRFVTAGVYRVSTGGPRFAHIRREGRKWRVAIRATDTGNLIHYAGIWDTLRLAEAEAIHCLT